MFGASRQIWILSESSTSSTDYYWYQVSQADLSSQPSWETYPSLAANPAGGSTGMVLTGGISGSNVAPSSSISGGLGIYNKNGSVTNYICTTANTGAGTTLGTATITNTGIIYALGQNGGAGTSVLYSFGLNGLLRSENSLSLPFSGTQILATQNGNVLVSGANVVASLTTATTPTINWSSAVDQSNWPEQTILSIGSDSTGNTYVAYEASHTIDGQVHPYLVQLNSSGSINWQKDFGSVLSSISSLSQIAVDSTGNVYSYGNGIIAKWNNSGSLVWQELLQVTSGQAAGQMAGGQLSIDAVDDIYVTTPLVMTSGGNVTNISGQITKLDGNGNLIFSNMFTFGNVGNLVINNSFFNSEPVANVTNTMYVTVGTQEDTSAGRDEYIWNFALPADGSYTGNTWTNSFGGQSIQYVSLSNVSATTATNISTTSGNLTTSAGLTSIGSTLGYAFAQQPIPGNLVSLGTSVYPPLTYTANYLIVAGGGGGAGSNSGSAYPTAGGGAGGLLSGSLTLSPGTTYSFTVGSGGNGGSNGSNGSNGGNSTAFGLTAIGGGGGGCNANGNSGGSGGGAYGYPNGTYSGGAGTAGQGYAGGLGYSDNVTYTNSGGGGGAGGAGGNASAGDNGGVGGVGVQSSITGTATYYAGGGGGANGHSSAPGGAGGAGGGGQGGNAGQSGVTSGTANTGGGGGGGCGQTGGNGGSGVVIISVPTSKYTGTVTGSPTVTTSGSNTILTFTGIGSYTA